jgi:type IV pilus assembly protein PilB
MQIGVRLLERLSASRSVSEDQMQDLQTRMEEPGSNLFRVLAACGLDSDPLVCQAVADVLEVAYVDVDNFEVSPDDIQLINSDAAHNLKALPLFRMDNTLTVGMLDPTDGLAIDALREESSLDIEPCLAGRAALEKALRRYYPQGATELSDIVGDLDPSQFGVFDLEQDGSRTSDETAPIVKMFTELLVRAIRMGASDVHIEPAREVLRIRYRIDGMLRDISELPSFVARPIVSHIKVLCSLQITETRRPQDGRYQTRIDGRTVDLRVSLIPTVFGESAAIRLLGGMKIAGDVGRLGFGEDNCAAISRSLRNPWGLFLVSGPTGSGKTTTLFTLLEQVRSREKKVVTIEDPVEYKIDDIRQIQVNQEVGLTFSAGLRSIVRQDPDIVLVGEVRDVETARIAIHAALTGHLVLTTLHTNDAPGAVTRLLDMGIEPYLISSAATGVIGQRLVRAICQHCLHPSEKDTEILKEVFGDSTSDISAYVGNGCSLCFNAGFSGRTAIAEVLEVDDEIRQLIMGCASSGEIRELAKKHGMSTMSEDGIRKVICAKTTLSEVARTVGLGAGTSIMGEG